MLYFFAAIASFVLLVLGSAGYLTFLACRWAHSHHWRIGWHLGLIGSAAGGIVTGCFILLGLSMQPGGWGKLDLRPSFFWVCVIGAAVAIIPAEIVVWYHRRKQI
jgi:hypothetical protein